VLELAQAALPETAVDDDGNPGVAGELLLQVFVKLRPVARDDEHQLSHRLENRSVIARRGSRNAAAREI
jgi:hypothetical protein